MSTQARFVRLAASSIAMLGLAACAHPAHLAKAPLPAPAPVAETAPEPAPPQVEPVSLKPGDLRTLKNLSEHDVTEKLGKPDFTRHEASAQIWQYRDASCVLELFLYPDGADLKVAHAVSRSRTEMRGPEDQCVPIGAHGTAS